LTFKEHLTAIGWHAQAIIEETFVADPPDDLDLSSPYDVFLTPNAFAINVARQDDEPVEEVFRVRSYHQISTRSLGFPVRLALPEH